MHAKRIAIILAAVVSLATPSVVSAHKQHRAVHHRHARIAGVEREYWPILEEWLTPQEGREVEADVTAELNEVADPETSEGQN
jgi:hypothetical protein